MKPLQQTKQLSYWGIRISISGFLVLHWISEFLEFVPDQVRFYMACIALGAATLIIVGSISRKENYTLIGGLLVFLLYLYLGGKNISTGISSNILFQFLISFTGLSIFSSGNRL